MRSGSRTSSVLMSGSRRDRPGLLELLSYARKGDTIVVVALDRLGRSMTHVLQTIEELQGFGFRATSGVTLTLNIVTPNSFTITAAKPGDTQPSFTLSSSSGSIN